MLNVIFLFVFALLCIASGEAWRQLIQRVRNRQSIILPRLTTSSALGLVDVGIMFATWIAGQILTIALMPASAIGLPLNESSGDEIGKLIGIAAICQLGSTAVGLAILCIKYRSVSMLGFRIRTLAADFKLGGISFLLVVPPLLILQWLLTHLVEYRHSTLEALKNHPTAMTLVSVWLAAVVAAPICEEVFFRGILQGWLQRLRSRGATLEGLIAGDRRHLELSQSFEKEAAESSAYSKNIPTGQSGSSDVSETINPYSSPQNDGRQQVGSTQGFDTEPNIADGLFAIFLSALIFAGVHIGQGLAPIPLFFLGLVLGYLFFKTGSLLPCIVLHAGLNGFSMFWFTVGVLTQDTPV